MANILLTKEFEVQKWKSFKFLDLTTFRIKYEWISELLLACFLKYKVLCKESFTLLLLGHFRIYLIIKYSLSSKRRTKRPCSVEISSCRVWGSRLDFSRNCGARKGLCWSRSLSTSNRRCCCSALSYAASSNSGGWAARRTQSGKMSWRYKKRNVVIWCLSSVRVTSFHPVLLRCVLILPQWFIIGLFAWTVSPRISQFDL